MFLQKQYLLLSWPFFRTRAKGHDVRLRLEPTPTCPPLTRSSHCKCTLSFLSWIYILPFMNSFHTFESKIELVFDCGYKLYAPKEMIIVTIIKCKPLIIGFNQVFCLKYFPYIYIGYFLLICIYNN